MKVIEMIEQIRLTRGKSLSLFMNMHPEASLDEKNEAYMAFLVYANNGIMELSKSFNLFSGSLSTYVSDPSHIQIHDPKMIDIDNVFYNGEELQAKQFTEFNNNLWYQVNGVGLISVSPQLVGKLIYIKYYKLAGRVVSIEDDIPVPDVFLKALESFIMKEITGDTGGSEEDAIRGASYRSFIDSFEELEQMGYQRTSYITFDQTNMQKGWYEW